MKKLLLFIAVAMTAMTVNAQNAPVKAVALNANRFDAAKTFNLTPGMASDQIANVNAKNTSAKIIKNAEANDDVFGVFVQTFTGDVVEDFTGATTDTIWKANQVMTIPVDNEGNTTEVTCNICLKSAFGGYRITEPYYGVYEETEDGAYIFFPEQISLKADGVNSNTGQPYHYDCYMYNVVLSDDGTQITNLKLLQFEGDEEGIFYNTDSGWGLYYTDRETGSGLGFGAFIWNSMLMEPNGTVSWGARDNNDNYNITTASAFIEDYETSVAVYGWYNTKLTMQVEDDLSVKIRTGAPIADYDLKEADGYMWDAGKIVLSAWVADEEGHVHIDDADYIYGELKGNQITIPGIMTHSENGGTGDYAGYYYGLNFIQQNIITLNEGNFAADADSEGIEETSMTREEKIKSTKTYNLMGQQVNRSKVNGLLIRDGKKYVNR